MLYREGEKHYGMKTLQYALIFCLAVALMDCGPTKSKATDPMADMDGWHFHICQNETKASRVWFELSGTNDNAVYQAKQIKWMSGRNTFINVPKDMRYINDMNLSIRTSGNRKAKVCVLYGSYVIKSIEVTGTETNKLSKENRDNCPC
jgi:hypothetical protein